MFFNDRKDHQRAKEFSQHEANILRIRNRARSWRLTDCDEGTLNRMRHALLDELEQVEKQLKEADAYFLQCIEASDPLATEQALMRVNRLSAEWNTNNKRLQDTDHAVLERHLRNRLISLFGTERRLNFIDSAIFAAIIVVILITLVEFIWLAIDPTHFSPELIAIDTIICIVLLLDFCTRLWLSEDRRWYIRNYWIDFVSSIPLVGILRVGRLVRLARFARLLRLFRLGRAMRSLQHMFRGLDKLEKALQIHLLRRSFIVGIVMLFAGAFAIYYVELHTLYDPIEGFSEGFWWSFTTVITGGFADLYNPTTEIGRIITGLLVIVGLVIVSIFTASMTSVLVGDSSKAVERKLTAIEADFDGVTQRLDLLSNETNAGLLALETVAQQLSNQQSAAGLAQVLTRTMLDDFEAIQSSVHTYDADTQTIQRIMTTGLAMVTPPETLVLGEGFIGEVSAELLQQDLTTYDVEPVDIPCIPVKGISLICPLVAQGRLLGVLYFVMPSHLGRFYLYNRAPMTLAHHAAIALHAIQMEEGRSPFNAE